MRKLLLLLTITVYLAACKKEKDQTPVYDKKANVAYGTDALQVMDLYLPADGNASSTKLMVLIHGGAWADGDKADFDIYIDQLKRRLPDYAFANINYRLFTLSGQNKFPAQEQDVKAAVTFLLNKSTEYKFSKTFVLLGASAGGHLALLQGYKYAQDAAPKAIVSLFGPTDLTHLYNNPPQPTLPGLLAVIVGGTPAQNAALYEASSPISFVNSQSAHTLLLHGGKDNLVPPAQATRLIDKLKAAGVYNEYVFYPDEGHSWTGPNLEDSFNKIEKFIRQHVP
jgi:acetyl esterase/lipase